MADENLLEITTTSTINDADKLLISQSGNPRVPSFAEVKAWVEAGTDLSRLETDTQLQQLLSQPDFTLGQQSWNAISSGSYVWNANDTALTFTYNPTSAASGVHRAYSSGSTVLTSGHRYALIADIELSGNGETSGLYDTRFNPFVNGSGINPPEDVYYTIGQNGATIRHNAVHIIDVVTGGTFGNTYFSAGSNYRDSDAQTINSFNFTCVVRACYLVDLGDSTSPYYDLDATYIGDTLARMAPWVGSPPQTRHVQNAIRAGYAIRAESAAAADLATSATQALDVKSSWHGKHLLTVGHSLVSQQAWQGPLINSMGISTLTVQGISGGTVQPQPSVPTDGFYSRAYWTTVLAALPDDGQGGKVLPDATILWVGANDNVIGGASGQTLELLNANDRIMTTAEQDEFETRNTTDGASAVLSDPLTGGLVVTYRTLMLTAIRNAIITLGLDDKPEHRMFIVREPQFFHDFDTTMDWGGSHWEKNEVHKTVADYWSLPLIDLWRNTGINIATRGWFMLNESSGDLQIHVNDKGGAVVAAEVEKVMDAHPFVDLSAISGGSNLGIPDNTSDNSPWIVDNTS